MRMAQEGPSANTGKPVDDAIFVDEFVTEWPCERYPQSNHPFKRPLKADNLSGVCLSRIRRSRFDELRPEAVAPFERPRGGVQRGCACTHPLAP